MPMETAYGRAAATRNPELTDVGPGTPAGELFRRYWQPVALVADATTTPRKIKILGEDLVLFRTRKGEPGLVHPNCAHRGASLYYGKVEDDGIRCCYHGGSSVPHPDPADPSRGGSAYVHDSLRPGSLVRYDGPRSTFPLGRGREAPVRGRRHRHHAASPHGPRRRSRRAMAAAVRRPPPDVDGLPP
ncbi:Rieske 2Fe-2S domain-containing protein [Actinomadura madurae]|uniref:Rieske 2Fe-2S domain-containing protein n=1 Tax=Actinomadura madurae TaxID=1993 RepID=UPI0020267470|nr:Rieske 2Fe-2S domain-containing protein [Actinomadura madurae]URN07230.1 Rieske 2Fe-2S domain-containing protein [Actinomadura madurae]